MTRLTLEAYDELVGLAYGAGADPGLWPDFIKQVEEVLGYAHLALFGHDTAAGLSLGVIAPRFSDQGLRDYTEHFHAVNPFVRMMLKHPEMQIVPSYDMVPRSAFLKGPFYNDFLHHEGRVGGGGGGILMNDEGRLLILAGHVEIRHDAAKSDCLVDTLNLLAPHIRRAFEMQRMLQGQRLEAAGYREALDRVGQSVFLLDARGRMVFANASARRALRDCRHVCLRRDETLAFPDRAATAALARAVGRLLEPGAASASSSFPVSMDGSIRLAATLDPFVLVEGDERAGLAPGALTPVIPGAPVAMLTLADADLDARRLAARLREVYGLSPAERSLAVAIAEGQSLEQVGLDRGVSVNTVRNQLQSVFAKTGCSRQNQLASRVLGLR